MIPIESRIRTQESPQNSYVSVGLFRASFFKKLLYKIPKAISRIAYELLVAAELTGWLQLRWLCAVLSPPLNSVSLARFYSGIENRKIVSSIGFRVEGC